MAAGYFLPVFPCCPISKQRYAYNGRYDIFDQGQLVGHIVFIFGPATEGVQRFYYAMEADEQKRILIMNLEKAIYYLIAFQFQDEVLKHDL
jgi:hypothetical protein